MDNSREYMYRVYKSQRDFIKFMRHRKLEYDEFLFLQKTHAHCEDLDKINNEFLDKWIKEIED